MTEAGRATFRPLLPRSRPDASLTIEVAERCAHLPPTLRVAGNRPVTRTDWTPRPVPPRRGPYWPLGSGTRPGTPSSSASPSAPTPTPISTPPPTPAELRHGGTRLCHRSTTGSGSAPGPHRPGAHLPAQQGRGATASAGPGRQVSGTHRSDAGHRRTTRPGRSLLASCPWPRLHSVPLDAAATQVRPAKPSAPASADTYADGPRSADHTTSAAPEGAASDRILRK